jgi:hypothetical protein
MCQVKALPSLTGADNVDALVSTPLLRALSRLWGPQGVFLRFALETSFCGR